ncbi:MAG: glycogen/starch/alpha-glucan phosphorylase [Acidobacteriota bacterium]|nr:glycogen/starch/alpha-glucan phosphorylase [Acidobacteriota bacterium]
MIPKPKPGGLDPDSILETFGHRMMYSIARDEFTASEENLFQGLAYATRDRLMDRWFTTQDRYYRQDVKRVYYLSLEFLLGRMLRNNMINLGAETQYDQAMERIGLNLEELVESENDAGLGNGGLGRLAACFLDSASTLGLPFYGYGIRYEYGIFRQQIRDGNQTESPDNWLRHGNPWEVARPEVLFPVKFYGRVESYTDDKGRARERWVDTHDVYAMAYDVAVPGYCNDVVNSLRLWAAKSSQEFDLEKFNSGAYVEAVEDKTSSENISKVLYPPDDQYAGRELRLKQQFFFTSATIQDILRRFKKSHNGRWDELPDRVAIQLNDTHPTIAIPELMRVLVDEEAVDWDDAWWVCERTFAYTNHTVLPEALESWPLDLLGRLLPRHLQIIREIDRRFRAEVAQVTDEAAVRRMAIIDEGTQTVRMANLAIVGSHSTNGVAALHTELLKTTIFPDFHRLFPRKFNNKTNGITPRRWLLQANPELSALITEAIGDKWPADLDRLRELEKFADDAEFRKRWLNVKRVRKLALEKWLRRCRADVEVDSIFDVQIKRIHEYKRQLLNVLHVISLYHRLMAGHDAVPRTVIFGGKAAPSYFIAKLIIKLIHDTAKMVRANPFVAQRLNVVFVPNYGVSAAEVLFPATELSEQISTAGTEASGTGNMKAVLNGAVIIGTLDGANIEIKEQVGDDNIFIFGNTAEQIAALRSGGYDSAGIVRANQELSAVIDRIGSMSGGIFQPIVDILLRNDRYFHCADYADYAATQERAAQAWTRRDDWSRMSILNTARSGFFSGDRTVREYAKEIWEVEVP